MTKSDRGVEGHAVTQQRPEAGMRNAHRQRVYSSATVLNPVEIGATGKTRLDSRFRTRSVTRLEAVGANHDKQREDVPTQL